MYRRRSERISHFVGVSASVRPRQVKKKTGLWPEGFGEATSGQTLDEQLLASEDPERSRVRRLKLTIRAPLNTAPLATAAASSPPLHAILSTALRSPRSAVPLISTPPKWWRPRRPSLQRRRRRRSPGGSPRGR